MSLCLAAGAFAVSLGASQITLAWTHSVEKTAWEEDISLTPEGIVLTQARVQGSGAGMDPPPDARLVDGFWRWKPTVPPQPAIVMRRSGATADWRVCVNGTCRPMEAYVPADADPVSLRACRAGEG